MASAQLKMTQNGRPCSFTSPVRWPVVMSASAMTPIVFCASLVPCDSETSEAVRDLAPAEALFAPLRSTLRVIR